MTTDPRFDRRLPSHRPGYPVSPRALRRRLRPDPPTASRPAVRRPRPEGPDRPGTALPVPVHPQPCASPTMRRRLRPVLVPLAGLVVVGVAALALDTGAARTEAAGATASAPAVSSGVAVLQGEIAAMEASGMPADHPKVELLRDDLAVMEAAAATPVVPEPGVDVGARVAAATGAAGDTGADAAASFDDGPVTCEPVPGLLTAADVEGASCSSTLEADGSSLYVAERPDGTARAVRFGADGSVGTVGTVTPHP
jgi:hypothetical protein